MAENFLKLVKDINLYVSWARCIKKKNPPLMCWMEHPCILQHFTLQKVKTNSPALECGLTFWLPYLLVLFSIFSLCLNTEERPCEDTARKRLSESWGERSQQNPTMLALWSWTISFQNCQKINFCCFAHLVYGILLQQPEQTNTIRIVFLFF